MSDLFFERVWKLLTKIPRGRVTTYKEIARALHHPRAVRAVGNACNANPNAPRVPCHRVVAANGSLGGFAGSLAQKVLLLKKEGILVQNNRIVDFSRVFWGFK